MAVFLMEITNIVRHEMIQRQLLLNSEKGADVVTHLWESMAVHLIAVVGEGGFNSLYARTLSLNKSAFPWLATSPLPAKNYQRFTELKMSLEGQMPAQAREANSLLLITFTDILASLIGEQLTTSILRSAWGDDASNCAGKEFENE